MMMRGNDKKRRATVAPPRKPMLELENPSTVGVKTTSLRLQGAQWAQMDVFASAMGLSANEFIQRAVDAYLKHVAKKPEVQKAIRKRINQQKQMLDRMMALTGVDMDQVDEDDEAEEEPAEDLDEEGGFEEVDDDD
jgi:cell division FtsZ-interacting protein ZapD